MLSRLPQTSLLSPHRWTDYELIDSGDGAKLERFGPYKLVRPEKSALWRPRLSSQAWRDVDAVFEQLEGGEGRWLHKRFVPDQWLMRYRDIAFWARLTPFRHTGVFPEQATQWDWISSLVKSAGRPINVLNLFGYTGIASLAAAAAGATVTQVDASKPALSWTRENELASGMLECPIRLIAEDAIKFVRREGRRGRRYEGIILDPPAFGRGPKGEIWRFAKSFPSLLETCVEILAERPLFVVVTAYAIEESALVLYNLLMDHLRRLAGDFTAGELVLQENGAGARPLSTAIYARWTAM